MGCFSYNCQICGGGYYRCSNPECPPGCNGGQFCWEDPGIMLVRRKQTIEYYQQWLNNYKDEAEIKQCKKIIKWVKSLKKRATFEAEYSSYGYFFVPKLGYTFTEGFSHDPLKECYEGPQILSFFYCKSCWENINNPPQLWAQVTPKGKSRLLTLKIIFAHHQSCEVIFRIMSKGKKLEIIPIRVIVPPYYSKQEPTWTCHGDRFKVKERFPELEFFFPSLYKLMSKCLEVGEFEQDLQDLVRDLSEKKQKKAYRKYYDTDGMTLLLDDEEAEQFIGEHIEI